MAWLAYEDLTVGSVTAAETVAAQRSAIKVYDIDGVFIPAAAPLLGYLSTHSTGSFCQDSRGMKYVYGVSGAPAGPNAYEFVDVTDDPAATPPIPAFRVYGEDDTHIQFMRTTAGNSRGDLRFYVDGRNGSATLYHDTAIERAAADAQLQAVRVVDENGDIVLTASVDVFSTLADPNVFEVPVDGWPYMMLLSRRRATINVFPGGVDLQDLQLADIVCYLSKTPRFTAGGTKGPFWLVDGLEAAGASVPARGWCSVPSAMVHLDEEDDTGVKNLYVYYVVEASGVTSDAYPLGDDPDWVAANQATRGIYCKKIPLAEIERLLTAGYDADPTAWDEALAAVDAGEETSSPLAEGTCARVRFWFTVCTPNVVQPFERVFPEVEVSDPAAAKDHGHGKAMYFAARYPAGDALAELVGQYGLYADLGGGIWRSSPVDTGVELHDGGTGYITVAAWGYDFLIRPERAKGYPDRVATTTRVDANYIDPDVGYTHDKIFRVMAFYVPGNQPPAEGYNGYLGLFTGDHGDGIVHWTDMFTTVCSDPYVDDGPTKEDLLRIDATETTFAEDLFAVYQALNTANVADTGASPNVRYDIDWSSVGQGGVISDLLPGNMNGSIGRSQATTQATGTTARQSTFSVADSFSRNAPTGLLGEPVRVRTSQARSAKVVDDPSRGRRRASPAHVGESNSGHDSSSASVGDADIPGGRRRLSQAGPDAGRMSGAPRGRADGSSSRAGRPQGSRRVVDGKCCASTPGAPTLGASPAGKRVAGISSPLATVDWSLCPPPGEPPVAPLVVDWAQSAAPSQPS